MGKIVRPIRRQIISSFYLILLWSILATLITWVIILTLFILYVNPVKPANYYEQKIPHIIEKVALSQGKLLTIDRKNELEEIIPLDGLDYQVLSKDGDLLFGSISKQYIKNQQQLLESINKNIHDQNKIVQYYLIFDENGKQFGAIGFRYTLSLASANPQLSWIILLLGFLALISPFVYFIFFSYLIGKKFSKQIEEPFNHLMEAAKKIQTHELDFQLVAFKSSKELNQLVQAFEDMRISLKNSLLRQWELEDERKEMVAAIAHDLRTPLTIIHGHVEGLLEGGTKNPERLDRYLQTIFSSTQRSIRLIDQLNEVSAIGRQNFIIEPESVNILEFIKRKREEYQILCAKKSITLQCTLAAVTGTIYIDVYRISQVLDNIMTNSIRYCPEYGEIDWIITRENEKLIFEIVDNGPGFQPEETNRIFDKFYRGDSSRSGADSNFGLGLYIAQMIVKKHGGTISVDNHIQGGAYTKVVVNALS